jgi:uncharacterized protein (DUF927 family)
MMSTREKNHIEIAATEYRMRGFSVIPLRSKDKRPTLHSWDPYKTERASWEDIERWFSIPKNIGIVTGAVSGIVVLDIDGPEGEEALSAIVARMGDLPATWISSTGKGRHYLFLHPGREIRNSANRLLSIDFRGDGGYIVAPPSIHPSGAEYKWLQDEFQDIAPAPEWLVEWMTADKQPAWIDEVLIELGRATKKPEKHKTIFTEKNIGTIQEKNITGNIEINKKSNAQNILQSCAFVQHCRTNAKTLSEPEWHAMITNVARADGGVALAHELSEGHPGYKQHETEAKIQHAITNGQPHTCDYIQTRIGFSGCPDGGCGVKAPVAFATSEIHLANAEIGQLMGRLRLDSDPSPALVLAPSVIDALATLRRRDMAAYTIAKTEIKGACKQINIRDLETIVKQRVDAQKELRLAERIEEASKTNESVTVQCNFGFTVTIPSGWMLNDQGTHIVEEDDQRRILPVVLYLSKRIHNADSGEEKVQLSFHRDNEWRHIAVPRPVAFNRSAITTLSTHALPVTSENAKDVINYLSDFEAQHMDTIPVVRSVSRMGWIGSNHFMPGAAGAVELDVEQGMAAIASGYTASGELNKWIECMREARQSNIVRLLMAASFAAPLLRPVGHRVFLVHIWGPSRGGKTAALKAALSIWGEPDTIMASFNSTKVGLERLAGLFSDLPLGVDERQIVGNRQDMIESLIYLIGMGKGKTRGTKGGGIQAAQQWRTIALTTGEEPLSGESSNTGIRTRVIEIYGQPFTDERVAASVHQVTKDHHGLAGEQYIKNIIENIQAKPEIYKEAHQMLMDELSKKYSHHMGATLSQLAMLALGDLVGSTVIFETEWFQAVHEALALVAKVAEQVATEMDADESVIAARKLMSWIRAHHSHFDDHSFEKYGYRIEGAFYILGHKYDEAIRELGFNSQRMLRDWSKRGWIRTERTGDKTRYRVRHWDSEMKQRVECIAFLGFDDSEKDE